MIFRDDNIAKFDVNNVSVETLLGYVNGGTIAIPDPRSFALVYIFKVSSLLFRVQL